ncbi:MAG: glucuronate isomerase, partial [Chthoniobacterales bacterium]
MPESFIHPDFLLSTSLARRLYHDVAAPLPIIDYHTHLSPADIATNRRFENLFEIWLEGDHYKWRAMRANGIAERLITGDASPREKFDAWAATVPMTLRNPLYHWTHLELARHFDIHELLDETTADSIWERANAKLPGLTPQDIFQKMNVEVVCSTDDPTDSLEHHAACRGLKTRVLPTFRPDRGLAIEAGDAWNAWVDALTKCSGSSVADFDGFLAALKSRHDFFHEMGARLSDHGLSWCPAEEATDAELKEIFAKARAGGAVTPKEAEKFAARVLVEVGRWNAEKDWTMQLHVGALRNTNSRKFGMLGRDAGFDSIGDWRHAERLRWLLDTLDRDDALPRTILYNVNPTDNYVFGTMIGNFQDGKIAGKIQLGSGWWFLDQREGIEWQINALSNLGLLSRFVGMLTDSRSFLSYPRHEYFR